MYLCQYQVSYTNSSLVNLPGDLINQVSAHCS